MPPASIDWTLPGSNGETILGNTHSPAAAPRGVAIVSHGFKGYKDYGFFPRLTQSLADAGFIALRMNFSHSGMTNNIERFERADLFERDTWNKQVDDLLTVATAVSIADLPGTADAASLPTVWIGHSRGGLTTLLAAGRVFDGSAIVPAPPPARLVALASPDRACSLDDASRDALRTDGSMPSPSSRTGQLLRVGRAWLEEIESDPEGHDPLRAAAHIDAPILFVHGSDDDAVPPDASRALAAAAAHGSFEVIDGAGHTFNCPNPLPDDAPTPPATQQMFDLVVNFALGATTG